MNSMKKTIRRIWGSEIDEQKMLAVKSFIRGEISLSEFMDITSTTQSGCYSMIVRATRILFRNKELKIK